MIGDECVIEGDCHLEDCVIWSGTHVQSGASISRSVVGADCVVKPLSKLDNEAVVAPLKSDLSAAAR